MTKKTTADRAKQTKNSSIDRLKVVPIQGVVGDNPFKMKLPRNKKYNSRDILRLHSQLIRGFIKGEIDGTEAKTLSYLCSNYLEALGQVEIESRLEVLEERTKKS